MQCQWVTCPVLATYPFYPKYGKTQLPTGSRLITLPIKNAAIPPQSDQNCSRVNTSN